MRLSLSPDESILWEGKPAYPLIYPLLTLITFFGWFLVVLGSFWIAVGVVSFFLFPIFAIVTVVAAVRRSRTHYYLTTQKIVSERTELRLEHLASANASRGGPLMKAGAVTFQTVDGSSFTFKRVKQPEMVRQTALNAKANLPSLTRITAPSLSGKPVDEIVLREVLIKCPYCGASVPQGTTKCPSCGGSL